jgi:hypothetical protein
MTSRKPWIDLLVLFGMIGVLVWSGVRQGITGARIALADEQTAVFEEMASKASAALAQSPPDFAKAVGHLEYVCRYYTSGSKQVAGSALDRIVERSRTSCQQRIIDMLRKAAGNDLGDNPQNWIDHYGHGNKTTPPGTGDR